MSQSSKGTVQYVQSGPYSGISIPRDSVLIAVGKISSPRSSSSHLHGVDIGRNVTCNGNIKPPVQRRGTPSSEHDLLLSPPPSKAARNTRRRRRLPPSHRLHGKMAKWQSVPASGPCYKTTTHIPWRLNEPLTLPELNCPCRVDEPQED
jgi:hypothetical protein